MPLIKNVRGVLVEKSEKEFVEGDGSVRRGAFCTILLPDGGQMQFWAPEREMDQLGEEKEVSGYSEDESREFVLRAKYWEGKCKFTLMEVI